MYQFFVEDEQVQQDRICIVGGDVNHIGHVLRMKTGEKIRISDQSGRSYFCRILEITEEEVWAQIEDTDEMGTEFSHKVYLFQGLPKSDKMELIIQKTVELGVYTVIPVAMKNCVVKLDEKKAAKKLQRWQAIAESAAKQSKRTVIPTVKQPVTYKEALKIASELDSTLVPYENERGMDAYMIPTADFHESEYVGEHFKCREYMTGFTGSAGTALITMDEACLCGDGRYYVHAAAQ